MNLLKGRQVSVKLYLKEWRDMRGLSLMQLAARTELSVSELARLEHESDRPWNSAQLAVLAEAIAVDPVDLLKPPPR